MWTFQERHILSSELD